MRPPNPGDSVEELFCAPLSEHLWNEFARWYQVRKIAAPEPPREGVWICKRDGTLVAGICIYPTDGPFALGEYFSVNPDMPPRLCAAAQRWVAVGLVAYAQTSGRTVIVAPRYMSGHKALLRAGFVESDALSLVHTVPGVRMGAAISQRARPAPKAKAPPTASAPSGTVPVDLKGEPLPPIVRRRKKGKKR